MADLGELEDLYYATCAKLKERLDDVEIRLSNGFIRPEDDYFMYNSEGFGVTDPVTAGDWKSTLLAHAAFLYDPLVEGIMNRAVFLKHKRVKEAETAGRLPLNGKFPGLRDVRNMSSGMIFGSLSEKYRITVQREEIEKAQAAQLHDTTLQATAKQLPPGKEKADRVSAITIPLVHSNNRKYKAKRVNTSSNSNQAKAAHCNDDYGVVRGDRSHRSEMPKAPKYEQIAHPPQRYISPYDLNERAKKPNQPGGSEMPCICDPECMCVPLCASDPTQNCFCEENALFCRVTEGMDVDDLSYPTKAVEEQEAETAGEEYMAQLMAMEDSHQETLETPSATEGYPTVDQYSTTNADSTTNQYSTTGAYPKIDQYSTSDTYTNNGIYSTIDHYCTNEPYSTLEPLDTLSTPIDSMDIDHPTQPTPEPLPTLLNGQTDFAAILRNKQYGGSLSIWAKESPTGGRRYRDLSCHWHDEMRADIEAHRQEAGPDSDLYYPHSSSYGRLDLQRIHEQCPSPGQRLLRLTRGSFRVNKGQSKSVNLISSPQSNKESSNTTVKQGKSESKTSLFASRLMGRSHQATSTPPKTHLLNAGQGNFNPVNTSKALPQLPK